MRMVNSWRSASGMNPLVWSECLAQKSNRPGTAHDGFGQREKCDVCPNGAQEAAFGSECPWNWWRCISIPMCRMLRDAHRNVVLDPNSKYVGYYQKLRPAEDNDNCDWGYDLRVQSC
jgi:hypothetical protein